MPVDLYVGGTEHAVLHLLYARFWHKVLYDAGHVSTIEPFSRLFNPGKIQAHSYRDANGKYYFPEQVEKRGEEWFVKGTDTVLETQVEKMSKSRYNVVNPDRVVEELGADSMRLYQMFMGPLDRDKPWTEEGLHGIHRFLRRVWSLVVAEDGSLNAKVVASGGDESMLKTLHQTIKSVTEDVQNLQFNTAISRMMEYLNAAVKAKTINRTEIEQYILLLSPFAPHMCEELWHRLGHSSTIAYETWPTYDETLLVEDTIEIPVQVNGKLRGVISVAADADKDTILAAAKDEPKVHSHIDGKNLVKEIYVPGKLVNLIAK
jgi:leucyl-tRNA synthetase